MSLRSHIDVLKVVKVGPSLRQRLERWGTGEQRQAKAAAYVRRSGNISLSDYRQLCPGWSDEMLRLDLVELAERGLLVKNGSCKGTYYTLVPQLNDPPGVRREPRKADAVFTGETR